MRRSYAVVLSAVLLFAAAAAVSPSAALAGRGGRDPFAGIKHIVVIYEENHSFDNLWGLWPGVDGISRQPGRTPRQTQVDRDGRPFDCLLQVDVNLTTSADPPPNGGLSPSCSTNPPAAFNSHFPNRIFNIDQFIAPQDTTCYHATPKAPFGPANGVPKGSGDPGGCTRDLVHRFYQEPYQIDHGRMDRYTVGSDAVGLTQGYYDTTELPLFQFLTGDRHAPRYVIADRFFQSAFGGSFLNHQWLIAARTPEWEGTAPRDGGPDDLHSNVLFQFHHQPFNYFANYGPGQPGRSHLKDEQDFLADARAGRLPAVSFVKPAGLENEHPGYTSVTAGEQHLVDLIQAIRADKKDWPSTAIVVTYDEFGGAWDHVPPPTGRGVSDQWGPGTRIPAMVISDRLPQRAAVDHAQYDTTSILGMIEQRFGLRPLSSRDAAVNGLDLAFRRHH